jgi:hypothetical protein
LGKASLVNVKKKEKHIVLLLFIIHDQTCNFQDRRKKKLNKKERHGIFLHIYIKKASEPKRRKKRRGEKEYIIGCVKGDSCCIDPTE